ncbi:MAG: hypothetical protein K2F81_07960 [Ruminococcus sp.]|nr:hypothetical protein [Ruminococcus sp.]
MKKYVCPVCSSRCDKPYCNECDCTIPSNSFVDVEDIEKYSYCNYCGNKVIGNKNNCPYCGEIMFKGDKKPYHYVSDRKQNVNFHFLNYILSFLIPFVGFIMGAIFLTRDDERGAGTICIVLGIISMFISMILYSTLL